MTPAAAPLLIVLVVLGLVNILRLAPRRRQVAAAHHFARKVDLDLPLAMVDMVGRRLALREYVGGATGLLAGVVAILLLRGDKVVVVVVAVLTYLLGHAVGHGIVAWYEATRPVPPGARLARATTPTHADYVAGHERVGAWVLAAVSALIAVGLVAADRTGVLELRPLPWALVVVAVVVPPLAIAADELAAARLLRRRQAAATLVELAWDDAMRARTLRDMATVPLVASAYAPLLLLTGIANQLEGGWPANAAIGVVNGLLLLLLVGLLGMAILSAALGPQRHFRRRLWPQAEAHPTSAPAVVTHDAAGSVG